MLTNKRNLSSSSTSTFHSSMFLLLMSSSWLQSNYLISWFMINSCHLPNAFSFNVAENNITSAFAMMSLLINCWIYDLCPYSSIRSASSITTYFTFFSSRSTLRYVLINEAGVDIMTSIFDLTLLNSKIDVSVFNRLNTLISLHYFSILLNCTYT